MNDQTHPGPATPPPDPMQPIDDIITATRIVVTETYHRPPPDSAIILSLATQVYLHRKALTHTAERLAVAEKALKEAEKSLVFWKDGCPPHPYDKEWFLARTKFGDRVVLTALPEEFSYDFKTADETYMKKENIIKWAQFPNSEFRTPLEDAEKEIAELRTAITRPSNEQNTEGNRS